MFYHCKNKSGELEVCEREYFRVCIIESVFQQISGLSRTFDLNFQHFPCPGNFYEKILDLSGAVETQQNADQCHVLYDLDTTLTLKVDLDIPKIQLCTKIKFVRQGIETFESEQDTQTCFPAPVTLTLTQLPRYTKLT